jgi:hypothetical protein
MQDFSESASDPPAVKDDASMVHAPRIFNDRMPKREADRLAAVWLQR